MATFKKDGVIYTERQIRALYKNISFPTPIELKHVAPLGFVVDNTRAIPEKTPAIPPNAISKLAFFSRFTTAETVGIYTAAKSNILLEVLLDKLKMAEYIDLDNADTIQAVQLLAQNGLITYPRANAILKRNSTL